MLNLLLLVGLLGVCSAHLCILSPHQRGTLENPLSVPSNDCYGLSAPCGGRNSGPAQETHAKGDTVTVKFQKNVSHWNRDNPGVFDVNMIQDDALLKIVASSKIPDDNHHTFNYTTTLTVPSDFHGRSAIIQVIYKSNSFAADGKTPLTFYSCTDINVTN